MRQTEVPDWDFPDPPPGCRWFRVIRPGDGERQGGCIVAWANVFARSAEEARAIVESRGQTVLEVRE